MLIRRRPLGTISYMAGVWAVPEVFARSWGRMIQYNNEYLCKPGEFIDQKFPDASYHAMARNQIVSMFTGDWLWMTDTDHTFDPDILDRMVSLLNAFNINVLTGIYRLKGHPFLPNIYWYNEEQNVFSVIAELDKKAPIQQIDCAGAGCLLVRRVVFERMVNELKEQPFDIMHPWSEDFSFFYRCRKLGIPVFAAPSIETRHLMVREVTEADYCPEAIAVTELSNKAQLALHKA